MVLKILLCCVGPFIGGGVRNCVRTYRGGHANADTLQTGGEGGKKGPKTAYILKERPLSGYEYCIQWFQVKTALTYFMNGSAL